LAILEDPLTNISPYPPKRCLAIVNLVADRDLKQWLESLKRRKNGIALQTSEEGETVHPMPGEGVHAGMTGMIRRKLAFITRITVSCHTE